MSVLAGCAGQAPPGGTDPATGQMSQGPQNCRDFTMPVTVGGQQQQSVGKACPQPDGSWRVTQNTPGLPEQVYTVPPQAMNIYPYPDPYPYYWGDPWFYGPGFYGPWFLPAVRFSWPSAISITMAGSTHGGGTAAVTAAVTAAAVNDTACAIYAHGACSMIDCAMRSTR